MSTRRAHGEGSIRQRAGGRWEARYVAADGRMRSIYGRTKAEVTTRLRDALRDAELGVLPVSQELTTGQYLRWWLDEVVRPTVRPSTLKAYEHLVVVYLVPHLGRVRLARLQPEHVATMLREVAASPGRPARKGVRGSHARTTPLSPTTVRAVYSVLRIALGRAVKLGKAHRNVCTLIDPPPKARRELQPLDAAQVRELMRALDGHPMSALFLTAVGTGMRQGELLALRWQDVDLGAGEARVSATLDRVTRERAEPKTARSRRVVPLPRTVVDALRAHRDAQRVVSLDGYVFAQDHGAPLDPSRVLRAFHAALAAAGLPSQPFHHLRHAYATLQLEAGEELANVSKVLGHADLSTTADLYAHLTPAIARRAADRMDGILAG